MRNINFYGSLGDFKKSIGMGTESELSPAETSPVRSRAKAKKRGMQADADRKTAEAMPLVMQDLVDIRNFKYTLPPDSNLAPHIAKRQAEGKKFVYENRLYQTKPKRVKKSK